MFKNVLTGRSGLEEERLEEAVVLALTVSQESRTKESRHPPESWKRQENNSTLELPEGFQPADTLISAQ